MCRQCFQRDPDRPFVRGENLTARLPEPPTWLPEFVAYLAAQYSVARACALITTLGRLLADEHTNHPQAVLERARCPGRSMGSLARALQDFFTEHRLALPTDQAERLAAGRRQRCIEATPAPLRPVVGGGGGPPNGARGRARPAGTRPRSDHTLEAVLAIVRDLAQFLDSNLGKKDWTLVDVHDIEAFLAEGSQVRKRRLPALRQFFGFARAHRAVLVDPTRGLTAKGPKGFTGQRLPMEQQRALFQRWTTDPTAHPHEALVGILGLLHGASSREIRLLRCDDINHSDRMIRLGRRPHPVPLDPASWSILQRCLTHRQAQHTNNPYVVVTRVTKTGQGPASTSYFSRLLTPSATSPRALRGTRLLDLVNTMDPKLVAAAFGMNPQAVMIYLVDHIDDGRLPTNTSPNP
jgi:site-specific recombinase XerD